MVLDSGCATPGQPYAEGARLRLKSKVKMNSVVENMVNDTPKGAERLKSRDTGSAIRRKGAPSRKLVGCQGVRGGRAREKRENIVNAA